MAFASRRSKNRGSNKENVELKLQDAIQERDSLRRDNSHLRRENIGLYKRLSETNELLKIYEELFREAGLGAGVSKDPTGNVNFEVTKQKLADSNRLSASLQNEMLALKNSRRGAIRAQHGYHNQRTERSRINNQIRALKDQLKRVRKERDEQVLELAQYKANTVAKYGLPLIEKADNAGPISGQGEELTAAMNSLAIKNPNTVTFQESAEVVTYHASEPPEALSRPSGNTLETTKPQGDMVLREAIVERVLRQSEEFQQMIADLLVTKTASFEGRFKEMLDSAKRGLCGVNTLISNLGKVQTDFLARALEVLREKLEILPQSQQQYETFLVDVRQGYGDIIGYVIEQFSTISQRNTRLLGSNNNTGLITQPPTEPVPDPQIPDTQFDLRQVIDQSRSAKRAGVERVVKRRTYYCGICCRYGHLPSYCYKRNDAHRSSRHYSRKSDR